MSTTRALGKTRENCCELTIGKFNQHCDRFVPAGFHVMQAGKVAQFDGSGGSGGPGVPPDYRNDDWSTVSITIPFPFCFTGNKSMPFISTITETFLSTLPPTFCEFFPWSNVYHDCAFLGWCGYTWSRKRYRILSIDQHSPHLFNGKMWRLLQ